MTRKKPARARPAAARRGAAAKNLKRSSQRSSNAGPARRVAAAEPVRLARVPKGRKPQYFGDPAIDKLLSMTLTLVAELSVARDRIDTLERLIEKHRLFKASEVDDFVPSAEVEAQRDARRSAYIARVLRAVQSELEETTNSAMPRSQEEVIAAVSS